MKLIMIINDDLIYRLGEFQFMYDELTYLKKSQTMHFIQRLWDQIILIAYRKWRPTASRFVADYLNFKMELSMVLQVNYNKLHKLLNGGTYIDPKTNFSTA